LRTPKQTNATASIGLPAPPSAKDKKLLLSLINSIAVSLPLLPPTMPQPDADSEAG